MPDEPLNPIQIAIARIAATHLGWRVTYLGAGLPGAEIAGAALQNHAAAVTSSIIYSEDELLSLRRYFPSDTRINAGGLATAAYRATLDRIGAVVVSSLDECCQTLERIRNERLVATTAPRP